MPTLIMFPVLVWFYMRLAGSEEHEVATQFGDAWTVYAAQVSAVTQPNPPPSTARVVDATKHVVTLPEARGRSAAASGLNRLV